MNSNNAFYTAWKTTTLEEASNGTHDARWVYRASKGLAEQRVWELAKKYPDVDFTTSASTILLIASHNLAQLTFALKFSLR